MDAVRRAFGPGDDVDDSLLRLAADRAIEIDRSADATLRAVHEASAVTAGSV